MPASPWAAAGRSSLFQFRGRVGSIILCLPPSWVPEAPIHLLSRWPHPSSQGRNVFFFFGLVAFFNLCLFLAGSLLPGVGFLQLSSVGFSVQWALSSQSTGSRAQRLQKPWPTGLAAPQHVGSSQTRDRTCVPCSSRQILNCRTTREIQGQHFKLQREAKSMPPDPGLEAIWGLR